MSEEPRAALMRERDHMLTRALALENRVAGLNMAIEIVGEELAAQGIEAGTAATVKQDAVHESPVPTGCAQSHDPD
jgi:hypothetical protein